MEEINIILPDGSGKKYSKGITPARIAADIGRSLAKAALAAKFNEELIDLNIPLEKDGNLAILTFDSEEGRAIYRHSASHILASAVVDLFPNVKLGIGPSIQDGFYYDFDFGETRLSEDDLSKIEKRAAEIIAADLPFKHTFMPRSEAESLLKKTQASYKLELLEGIEDDKPGFYQHGSFIDLCRGPHVPGTGVIKAFKLINIAGAYWRGDESRPMLTRIYGTAFPDQKALAQYISNLEEAKARDHRKLGRELELFHIYEEAGAGMIYYHPKGAAIRREITHFLQAEHARRGYQEVFIPHIAREQLWQTSGHTEYYRDNMYFLEVEKYPYVLKPMNCPGHILIYQSKPRSYRDLPVRYFELGTVYRYERSGVLHGLLRVREFTQDDAHIFCTPEQLMNEINGVIDFALDMLRLFGFKEYDIYLSTRPDKYVGTEENWDKATSALAAALTQHGLRYEIDEGEGVFYGPKIDIKLKDVLGRAWQGPTIQADFNLPQRFDLGYIGPDGERHQPVMIHRVVLGSLERFIGALIEHYAGRFPVWLAPVQVALLPIADRHHSYAEEVKDVLLKEGIRVEVDGRQEKIGAKIREAEVNKIPYMLVVGDKEVEKDTVNIRYRGRQNLGTKSYQDFMDHIRTEISEKRLDIGT